MTHAVQRNLAALAALVIVSSCTDTTGSSMNAQSTGGVGSGTGGFSPMAGASAGTGAGAAGSAGGTAGTSAGMMAGAGGAGSAQAGAGGAAMPVADSGVAGGGGDVEPDATTPLEIPDPVQEPYAWGFGIGVTDMPAAVDFYKAVMGLTVEKEVVRSDRTETVLYASEAQRGARLILMKFNDNRPTTKITAKLVWQAASPSAVNRAASSYPGYVSRITFPVVQFDGPETYIQEVGSIFDTEAGDIQVPYLVAMGFSVSDLAASRAFYSEGLGMDDSSTGTFPVTDATGSATITEYTERHPAGAGLVLQDWTPDRNSKDNPVMVVLFVPDAQAAADAVVGAGGTIVEPAARTAVYDNRLLIVAKDLDGYVLELVQ